MNTGNRNFGVAGTFMKKQLANLITLFRILGSISMLFFSVCSTPFYTAYALCGISDMIDGTIARKTNSVSEWGAKLDSLADFLFLSVSFCRFLPILSLPEWVWICGALIALIKAAHIIWGFVRLKTLPFLHSLPNKATGLMLFLFPLALHCTNLTLLAALLCLIAAFSALWDGVLIRRAIHAA